MSVPDKAIDVAQSAVADRLNAWSWYATDAASRAMALDVLLAAAPFIQAQALRDLAERLNKYATVAYAEGEDREARGYVVARDMAVMRADELEAGQ